MSDDKIVIDHSQDFETAKEYFEILKGKKQTIKIVKLDEIYENCLALLNKYKITNQVDAMRKLIFHMESLEAEKEAIDLGIDTFVYLDDIKEYIEKVPGRVVKCIELSRYEREVPDEVLTDFMKVKDLFTEFFVVFTDYTKEHEEKHKKETDPILFGMFKDKASSSVSDRMYYIGDWEDEYCDLTLDKMVTEMKACSSKNIEHTIKYPEDVEELKQQLKSLESNRNGVNFVVSSNDVKEVKPFFSRVKTFFGKK